MKTILHLLPNYSQSLSLPAHVSPEPPLSWGLTGLSGFHCKAIVIVKKTETHINTWAFKRQRMHSPQGTTLLVETRALYHRQWNRRSDLWPVE